MATREFSLLPVGALMQATSHVDRVLLPYYLVMHVWTAVGNGAVALRLLSVLAGAGTVAISARTAQIAWGSIAAVITGIALATNGQFISTSVDTRPYALVLLFTALATLSLVKMVSGGSSRGRWWAYSAAVSLAVLMQAFAILILLPHAITFWRRERRSLLSRWLMAAIPPMLIALFLVVVSNSQRAQVAWIHRGSVADAVHNLIAGTGESFHAVVLILAIGFVLAVQVKRRGIDDVWLMSLGLLIIPTTVLFVVSAFTTPVLVGRYVVSELLGAALLLGAGGQLLAGAMSARQLTRGFVAAVVITVMIGASFDGLGATLRSTVDGGDDYTAVANALTAQARVGDELIIGQGHGSGGFADGVAYYLHDVAFMRAITRGLPSGEPAWYERIVDQTSPFSTAVAQGGSNAPSVWVVETAQSPGSLIRALVAHACSPMDGSRDPAGFEQFGGISLTHFGCR
jgi:mannosyltransferase